MFAILFLKILFPAYNVSPHVPMDIIRVFYIPDFVAENLKANKNLWKRSFILQLQFHFKKPLSFCESQLLWNWKQYAPKTQPKNFLIFKIFQKKMLLFGVRKNICTAPFPDAQELLSWSTLKAKVCIFL